ncbi:MAG: hypothetical protein ACI9OJ_001530 [Myxococcota bacterium]|jgi:hypothetical protein
MGRSLVTGILSLLLVGCPGDDPDDGGALDAVVDSNGGAGDTNPTSDVPPFDGCSEDQCDIGGDCYANLTSNAANPCEVCSVVVDRSAWTADDSAVCDDGDVCTEADHCSGGTCVGDGPDCDDGDVCTDDSCDPATGECQTANNSGPCPATDLCMEAMCDAGDCAPTGESLDCDDDESCTEDSCDPASGCENTQLDGPCDDDSACTVGDECVEGECSGAPIDCDDGDICTVDVCKGGGCSNESVASLCEDDNPCTDESCDSAIGCVFPFNSATCDDASVCTTSDQCVEGQCVGQPIGVDDANLCTDDLCDPIAGPIFVANSMPCFDGNVCQSGDVCADTVCTPGLTLLECDDDNPCTDDECEPLNGCIHIPNSDPCDDESVCTLNDTCAGSACEGESIDCDDGNACTADSCDAVDGCSSTLIVSNACRPVITVDYPPRGATIQGTKDNPIVVVTGSVSSGAGEIASLSIGGIPVGVGADGTFSYNAPAMVGGNILTFAAEDSMGTPRERVQSFLWSNHYRKPLEPKTGILEQGLAIWFSEEILDDGDSTLPADDFASIFKLVLSNFDIGALLGDSGTPLTSQAGYDIYLGAVQIGDTEVTLKAIDGGLRIDAAILNITGALTFDCTNFGCVFLGGDSSGGLTVQSVAISSDILLGVNPDHTLSVQLQNTQTVITGVNLSSNNGWTNFLLAIIKPFILNGLVASLEGELNNQLSAVLAPLLVNALSALAFNLDLELGKLDGIGSVPISLATDFFAADFQDAEPGPPGGTLVQRAGGYTAVAATPYDNLGIPGRANCGGQGPQQLIVPKQGALEIVLADDSLNQILFAAWRGGFLEFDVPESLLGGVDLAGFGIANLDMTLSGMLAPTASDCNQVGEFDVHIGDLRIDASLELFGQQMTLVIWASFTAGLDLTADPGGIGIGITEVKLVATEVNVLEDDLVASEGIIKNLIETELIGGLLSGLGGGALGNIALPVIDLSSAVGLPDGTAVISIEPQTVSRQGGNTIIAGDLGQ